MYKAILFDLDDTLMTFEKSSDDSLSDCYKQYYSDKIDSLDNFIRVFNDINMSLWEKVDKLFLSVSEVRYLRFKELNQYFGINNLEEQSVAYIYELGLSKNIYWEPNAVPVLKHLSSKYLIGIITNGIESVQNKRYNNTELGKYSQFCLSSEKAGVQKPNKKIFEIALGYLDLKPNEVLMVGDSLLSDFLGSLNIGIDFCWYNRKKKELLPQFYSNNPKFIIDDLQQLVAFI